MVCVGMLISPLQLPMGPVFRPSQVSTSMICPISLWRQREPLRFRQGTQAWLRVLASLIKFLKVKGGPPSYEADLEFSMTWRLRRWEIYWLGTTLLAPRFQILVCLSLP